MRMKSTKKKPDETHRVEIVLNEVHYRLLCDAANSESRSIPGQLRHLIYEALAKPATPADRPAK